MFFASRHHLETASRATAASQYVGNNKVLCKMLGKYKMYVDSRDISISPHLIFDGFWEAWITLFIDNLVQPGWKCVDGGANFGYYTVLMADMVGPAGKVFSFEPGEVGELARQNVAINGFNNRVVLDKRALHRKEHGDLHLFRTPDNLGGAKVRLNADECRVDAEPTNSQWVADSDDNVRTVTLDELFAASPPDFIKLDVEGCEEAAMDGSASLMTNMKVRWLVEFILKYTPSPHRFLNKIVSAGFELRHVDYDSSIKSVTMDQLLSDPEAFWMLWLTHG